MPHVHARCLLIHRQAPEVLLCATKRDPEDYDKAANAAAAAEAIAAKHNKNSNRNKGAQQDDGAVDAVAGGDMANAAAAAADHGRDHQGDNGVSGPRCSGGGGPPPQQARGSAGMLVSDAGAAADGNHHAARTAAAATHMASHTDMVNAFFNGDGGGSISAFPRFMEDDINTMTKSSGDDLFGTLDPDNTKAWHYGPSADAWALGCFTYELVSAIYLDR